MDQGAFASGCCEIWSDNANPLAAISVSAIVPLPHPVEKPRARDENTDPTGSSSTSWTSRDGKRARRRAGQWAQIVASPAGLTQKAGAHERAQTGERRGRSRAQGAELLGTGEVRTRGAGCWTGESVCAKGPGPVCGRE